MPNAYTLSSTTNAVLTFFGTNRCDGGVYALSALSDATTVTHIAFDGGCTSRENGDTMFLIYTAGTPSLTLETTAAGNIRCGGDPNGNGGAATRLRPMENEGILLVYYESNWYCMEAEPN